MRASVFRLATPLSTRSTPLAGRFLQAQDTRSSTIASQASLSGVKRKSPGLSLEHFLLRSRVLSLYRTIVRAIYQIPDANERRDPIAHVKTEFMRNKNVNDTAQIRYLASTGKAEWDGMRRYVEGLAARGRAIREKQNENDTVEKMTYSEDEDQSRWERPRMRNVPR